ncbi:MAG: hypothetical protein ACLQT6_15680 [Desulfomonilaceae bacterium]
MRKFPLFSLTTIILLLFVIPASAWDFSMKGEFEWRYRYLGRANGYKDLFGDMRFQDSPLNTTGAVIGFAGPNFWRGYNGQAAPTAASPIGAPIPMQSSPVGRAIMLVRSGFSYTDSDGSENDQRMTFSPTLRVNNALRFWSQFSLGSIREKYNHRDFQTTGPMDNWYQFGLSRNAFDTAMKPSIHYFYCSLELPWGTILLGPRYGGIGSVSLQRVDRLHSALQILVPYGPFVFQAHTWYVMGPPMGWGTYTPYTGTGPIPDCPPVLDREKAPAVFYVLGLMYGSGPIQCSFGVGQILRHVPSYLLPVAQANGIVVTYPNGPYGKPLIYNYGGMDFAEVMYSFAFRYNNGRFFANLEIDADQWDQYFLPIGKTPADQISGAPPLFTEYSMLVTECGVLSGPAKLGLLCGLAGGPVLNNGNPTKAYGPFAIDHIATDAYNYLLFHTYGGGNDAPWAGHSGKAEAIDENGAMADVFALATRLDYAVAANLNVWGSYMWGRRAEQNGWLAGQKSSNGTPAVGTGPAPPNASGPSTTWTVVDAQNWKHTAMPGAGADPRSMNPYVDDNFLGWEAGLGIDWKLLENMTFSSRYAYWQPGPWFDQAYQVIGQLPGGAATTKGFLQGRSAIQAFEAKIYVDF